MMSRAGIAGCAFAGALFALAGSAQAQDTVGPQLDAAYHNYQPPYPDTAQINGEQGNVVLDVQVNSNGRVRNVKIAQSSGFGDLDNAAIEGVLSWRYRPAVVDGDTVTSWTKVTIAFRLPTQPVPPKKI
jgi:protein TonB